MELEFDDLKPFSNDDKELALIAQWLQGDFNCLEQVEREAQTAKDSNATPVRRARVFMRIVPASIKALDQYGYVFYLEQSVEGYQDAPYRQRVYLLARNLAGQAINRIFDIKDAAQFIGAWKNPALLQGLNAAELRETVGCDVLWTRTDDTSFSGQAGAGGSCRTSYGGATHITVEIQMTADVLKTLDQGFNDEGTLIFGPSVDEGAYEFRKQN